MNCDLGYDTGGYQCLEEYAGSIFRDEVCRMRNWLLHRQVEKKVVTQIHGME
jgi:hypothetical protein